MNDEEFIAWRDDQWVTTALENLEHLDVAHEIVAELGVESINPAHYAGRAALILLELERRAAGFLAVLSTRSVARYLHDVIPYGFEGGFQRCMNVEDALRRGYWACADTSAAAAAVFYRSNTRGRPLRLCTETVDGLPSYAHTRLVVAGNVVEPWAEARRPEAQGCTLLDDVSALLRARRS